MSKQKFSSFILQAPLIHPHSHLYTLCFISFVFSDLRNRNLKRECLNSIQKNRIQIIREKQHTHTHTFSRLSLLKCKKIFYVVAMKRQWRLGFRLIYKSKNYNNKITSFYSLILLLFILTSSSESNLGHKKIFKKKFLPRSCGVELEE